MTRYSRQRLHQQGLMEGRDPATGIARYIPLAKTYKSQAARDAQRTNYGNERYWDYLDTAAQEAHDYFIRQGDKAKAAEMFTRSLSESLMGNEGI